MAKQAARVQNISANGSYMESDDCSENVATLNITEWKSQKTDFAPRGALLNASEENMTKGTPDENSTLRKSSRLLLKSEQNRSSIELYHPDDLRTNVKSRFLNNIIQVGSQFQAEIPDMLCKYDDITSQENNDVLLWSPSELPQEKVEEFLSASETLKYGRCPQRGHRIKDNEQDLKILQECGYDAEVALRLIRKKIYLGDSSMSPWTLEECKSFEDGFKEYGKNFVKIHKKVKSRSVKEVVHFYYLWKKTERHDVFVAANNIEKKNKLVKPECIDFMSIFMDEEEYSYNVCNSSSNRIQTHTLPTTTSQPNLDGSSLNLEFHKLKIHG